MQRHLDERPWLTCGEIAEAIGEPSARVSECLNKLKHEGRAQQRKGMGASDRSLWAGTSEGGRERREARLAALLPVHEEHAAFKTADKVSRAMRRAWTRAGAAVTSADA